MARAIAPILIVFCLLACGRKRQPLEVSFWYWHTPFQLSDPDIKALNEMGVKRLFVRGGTFTSDGTQAMLAFPQQWTTSSKPFKLVLVYNFDSGLLKHFADFSVSELSARIADDVQKSAAEAQKHGEKVEGIQLDVDCPTRLLPRYAEILKALRGDLSEKNWSVSVTGLASWLGTSGIHDLAEEVDFIAPQFYETRMGLTADETKPVSDPVALAQDLPKAGDLPIPVYAGLACYGHAILYDEKGKVAQMYRGLSPDDALRHPALEFQSSTPIDENGKPATAQNYVGEDLLDLKAVRPGRDGKGLGYQIQYLLPTPQVVKEQLQIVRRQAPSNCAGIIFYRMPEPGDAMALPLVSMRDVLKGVAPKLEFGLKIESKVDPWQKVEASFPSEQEKNLYVKLTNTGNCPTAAAPDAVQVEIRLPGVGLEALQLGDFDSADLYRDDGKGDVQPVGLADANVIVLSRGRILPGQAVESGEIRAYGNGKVSGSWRAMGPGGFSSVEGK